MFIRIACLVILMFALSARAQNKTVFEGVLTYDVFEVNDQDSVKIQTVIFCKDSLIKVVNFHEVNGTQTLLKHLSYGKSYIMVEIDDTSYAIRTNEHLEKDTSTFTFEKKCKTRKIGGLKSRKIKVKYSQNKLPLTCYFSKKIPSKYANAMVELPGLPTLYYSFSDRQIFRHLLKNVEYKPLPLSFFMIPEDFQILTWEQFIEKFSTAP